MRHCFKFKCERTCPHTDKKNHRFGGKTANDPKSATFGLRYQYCQSDEKTQSFMSMSENKHGKILIVDDNEDLLKAAKMH
ncbi:MAG TPA: hypothetical protein VGQ59_01365, partial [Cyclobacteriaceae bacterium]|nr:hypothetical protein [Cyclobacteriaceae bacterium]